MGLNPNVWMPHLKFVLQTIAITYPRNPNDVSKKKYYDLIENFPLFIPILKHFFPLIFLSSEIIIL